MMLNKKTIKIRSLTEEDWKDLRSIRLKALRENREAFGSSYEKEAAYTEKEWRHHCDQKNGCVFGLYKDKTIIGLTGVFRYKNDPDGKTAILAMSYLEESYRKQGLSRLFYEERIKWARHNKLEKMIVSHRESNTASFKANQAFGFVFTHKTMKQWHDGKDEYELFYELTL